MHTPPPISDEELEEPPERLLTSLRERAIWFLSFLKRDLRKDRIDWKHLRSEWWAFLHPGETDPPAPKDFDDRERLRYWQREIRNRIDKLRAGKEWRVPIEGTMSVVLEGGKFVPKRDFMSALGEPERAPHIVADILASGILRECVKCKDLFLKSGRQVFCSTRCYETMTKQRYRKRKKK